MTALRPGWRPLAILPAAMGALHFTPKPFARTVPRQFGDPNPRVHGLGVAGGGER